jgi:L-threonylcarbamoyladenylate synthase
MTRLLPASPAGIAAAAGLLRAGELVAFGTETVYGLGADATQGRAVAAIFAAKGRPAFNPLICHYASAAAAFAHVSPTPLAERLAAAFWPGPLTMVLPRRASCPVDLLAGAGLDTLAVRVPAGPVALTLIAAAGRPIAAPSANRSGGVSPTTAAHVLADLDGRIAAILESGACKIGVESTVLDLTGPQPILLRPGAVPADAIQALTGPIADPAADATLRSPGLLASHYAPSLKLRLEAASAAGDEALLAFGHAPDAALVWNLSETEDLGEAASRLFAGLRHLDMEASRLGLTGIAAMPIPARGLGLAINDRLRRAAAPRT